MNLLRTGVECANSSRFAVSHLYGASDFGLEPAYLLHGARGLITAVIGRVATGRLAVAADETICAWRGPRSGCQPCGLQSFLACKRGLVTRESSSWLTKLMM